MKFTKFVYLPDPHGHHVNKQAWGVAKAFIADYQPERIVIGGDFMDLSPLRKGASQEEMNQRFQPDFEAGMKILQDVMPTDVIMGNHDFRLFDEAENNQGPIGDLCDYLARRLKGWCKENGIKLTPYDAKSYVKLGPQLKAMHGNCANMHSAKKMSEAYGCVIYGHVHRVDYYRANAIDRREAWACGCLCDIWQRYNSRRQATLSHEHGFAYGEYSNKTFDVQIAQRRNGIWRINNKTY